MSLILTRAYDSRAAVDDVRTADRTVRCRICTGAVDRFNTVIDPHGIRLSNFLRNPVGLWEHGQDATRGALPVFRATKIEPAVGPNGPELLAEARFFTDEFADRLFRMYRDGDLRAWSVRIVPDAQHCGPPTRSEIRARPELASVECCYRKADLAEFSAVAVPGNQECLTVSEARSVLALAQRGLSLPPDLLTRARSVGTSYEDRCRELFGEVRPPVHS